MKIDAILIFILLVAFAALIVGALIYMGKRDNRREKQQTAALTLDSPPPPPGMKNCFWCKASIPADAMICQHCGRDNRKLMIQSQALSQIGVSLLIIAAIVFGLICLLSGGLGIF